MYRDGRGEAQVLKPEARWERLFREHFWQNRGGYAFAFVLIIGAVMTQLLIPKVLESFADAYAAGTLSPLTALEHGFWLLLVAVLMAAIRIASRLRLYHLGRKFERSVRSRLFAHWLRLPAEYYQGRRIGDLMAHATNDINLLREKANFGVMMLVEVIFLVSLSMVMMGVTVHPLLTFWVLLPLPLLSLAAYVFRRRIQRHSRGVQEAFADLNTRVQEFCSGIQVIKAFVQEPAELARYEEANRGNVEANRRLIQSSAAFAAMSSLIVGLSFLIALTYGGWLAMEGRITLGQFIAFHTYLAQLIWPIESIGRVINVFQRAAAAEQRIAGILAMEPSIRDEEALPVRTLKGHIVIRDLTFFYPGNSRPALHGVTLDIPAGSTLGVVGRVGSGKSTLVQLLLRLFDPPPGSIQVDGMPLERIPLAVLRSQIGYVPQDNFLFSTAIYDNIDFHPVSHTEAEVHGAASLAHIHEKIMQFPRQYGTLLGERGVTLSGGQRQRVCMARALLKEPSILILDDSLSAVDADTETRILQDLRRYRSGRTTIIVSHRISSVQDADQIIVLDEGRIVEQGTHDALLAAGGVYAQMAARQQREEPLPEKRLDGAGRSFHGKRHTSG